MNKIIVMSVFLSTPIFAMQKKELEITNELKRIICITYTNQKSQNEDFADSYAISPGVSRKLPHTYQNPLWIGLSIDQHFNYMIKKVIISQTDKNFTVKMAKNEGFQEFVSIFKGDEEIICVPLPIKKIENK